MKRAVFVVLLAGLPACQSCLDDKPEPTKSSATPVDSSKPTRFAKPYNPAASVQFGGSDTD